MKDWLYEDLVTRYAKNFVPVVIPNDTQKKIDWLCLDVISKKMDEGHHIEDGDQEFKRFYTGFMGEAACEILLCRDIIDWTAGDSSKYNRPDIEDLNVGIKTVERDKFPIIFKHNEYGQIICVKSDRREDVVFVCGYASPEVLNRYQSDTLIISQKLRDRGSKTGFYGFSHLIPIRCFEDLQSALESTKRFDKSDSFCYCQNIKGVPND